MCMAKETEEIQIQETNNLFSVSYIQEFQMDI